jgi:hypothetical protein
MNGLRIRMLVQFAASMVLILVFSSMNIYTLSLVALGGGMMLFAFFSYYRVGAISGFLLVTICAGASAEIPTLTEAGPLMTATVGLVVPIVGLALFALSSEFEGDHRFRQKAHVFIAGVYATACLASVPISVSLVGAMLPSLGSRLPGLVEMAFVLLVASVGATLLVARETKLN